MGKHRPDHSGDRSDGFENDRPMTVALGEKGVGAKPQQLGEAERETVREAKRLVMNQRLCIALLVECGGLWRKD